MIITQLSPVFAANYANSEEVPTETYETLEEYLEVYFPNTALEDITELTIDNSYNYVIKDMSGISKLKNLTRLELSELTCGSVDVSELTNLNILSFRHVTLADNNSSGCIYGIDNLANLNKLFVWYVRTNDLNLSKMTKLKELELYSVRNLEGSDYITVNGIENATELIYVHVIDVLFKELNFTNCKNIKYLMLEGVSRPSGTYVDGLDFSIEEMGVNQLENLVEFKYNGSCALLGMLSFEKSEMLTRIDISFNHFLSDNFFSNFCINISGKKIKGFSFKWLDWLGVEENFDLNSCIITDNYSELNFTQETRGYDNTKINKYSFERDFYYTVEQFIDDYGYNDKWDDGLWISTEIKDYSGLSKFPNISWIIFSDMELGNMNFTELFSKNLKKLETISINGCQLTGNLNFSNYDSLKAINMNEVTGDMSNITIDVRGLKYLSSFSFDAKTVSNFELEKNILADSYFYRRVYISEENEYQVFRTVYKDIDEYLAENYPEDKKEDMTYLSIWATILDYSGLSELNNLEELHINNSDLNNINFGILSNLKSIDIRNCILNGTLDFRNNTKLKSIDITGEGDLSNTVIDIRGMEWLNYFNFSHFMSTGFVLKDTILTDDYNNLIHSTSEVEYGETTYESNDYYFNREFYYTIDEYLEVYYPDFEKEEITELSIGNNVIIKDYSGLSTLINLTRIEFYNIDLTGMNFEVISKLENIYVYSCTLDGKLDFTKNSNLKNIDVNFEGDLTNAIVDIRGLTNLEYFNYEYYTDESSNFNLDICILRDSTLELIHNSDAESMYESYRYGYTEDPDYPDYPEYPEYIVSNLNTSQIGENTKIIYGFVLNNEGNLKVVDILSRNYFAEGITAKIFEDGTEVTNTDKVVGTGTVIKLYEGEELVEEYIMVIFGDTTGDGLINAVDALAIIKNKNQNVLFENIIFEEAGKVTDKSYWTFKAAPSAVDALAIIKYLNGKYDIDQRDYYYGIGGPITG